MNTCIPERTEGVHANQLKQESCYFQVSYQYRLSWVFCLLLFCFIAKLHILWPFWKGLFCPVLVAHAQLSVHFPLLFVQILVQATKSSHDIAIYVDDSRKLDCRESLDYVRFNPANPFLYSKGKTCSVSGVFYLAQGSELTIRILTSHTAVILKPENTNFGAILLKT